MFIVKKKKAINKYHKFKTSFHIKNTNFLLRSFYCETASSGSYLNYLENFPSYTSGNSVYFIILLIIFTNKFFI